jgi:hypothetical protein
MQASFDNTVQILIKAFLEGTLLKGDCHACAVGNICASAIGTEVTIEHRSVDDFRGVASWRDACPAWINLFVTHGNGIQQLKWLNLAEFPYEADEQRQEEARNEVAATGYAIEQMARIEKAFETAAEGYGSDAEFAGLMAVVDVLADIHGVDLTAAEQAKALFIKA